MKQVLVVQEIHPAGMEVLRQGAEVIIPPDAKAETLRATGQEAQALVVRLTRVTASLIEGLPKLKVIGRNGVGVDNIDLAAATSRGIAVVNTPGANAIAVAEYTLGAMLILARHFLPLHREVRQGRYQVRDTLTGRELAGKTLGLVGFGTIGQAVGELARALGMQVCFYDPYLPHPAGEVVGCRDLGELLAAADFVSLHVPLTGETRHLIGEEELQLMKPGAYLINAARGGVVDEEALYAALVSDHLGGAALDVLEAEPFPPSHPLYGLDNVVITPHIAGQTEECMARMGRSLAEDVLRVLDGQKPVNLVNPEVWPE